MPPARRFLSTLIGVSLMALATITAACTEKLDGGASCPSLCPGQVASFKDTTFEAVVLDTSIGDFPTLGLAEHVLIANRKDTLETRGVIRFDALPTNYKPADASDTVTITAIDSVYLLVVVDSTAVKGVTPVTLQAFDVDTLLDDSDPAVVKSLYRADRLIGGLTFTPSLARDTLRIPLSKAAVLDKLRGIKHLRVGLRFAGNSSAQLRFLAFSSGVGAPQLSFDPSTDATYAPIHVAPSTTLVNGDAEELLALTVYTLTDRGTPPPPAQSISVGGWPGRRAYFRFSVPKGILDSSTIVRADLLLSQRPSTGVDLIDSLTVQPMIGTATTRVTDLRRAAELVAEGTFSALDSTRLAPGGEGLRAFNIVNLVRSWRNLSADVPPVLILRSTTEGSRGSEVVFFSTKTATASLRPRLRITYLPRSEFALP